ncbi:hypothetical protein J7E24_10520 [Hymenobacter sp. ISL-91]|uniref:hypothetical protein n=1 Tax=Hymenobacter sp. ISL-91 TaxID=2819151 RepID=UPI001BE54729|nr:hypothetical protein [Hymenobacter sp. ISL-91]MBT2558219.1 hypothetical protein [Hymenobacter sp. ISL-91]
MSLSKVLITVKTYPTLSSKYDELVCTAGFLEDGTWIRIYPIPFRKLEYEIQYKKYDWIEIDLEKYSRDFRLESYRPQNIEKGFRIIGHLDTRDHWRARKEVVLKNVYTNMSDLILDSKNKEKYTSLAVLKPKTILNFKIEKVSREWDTEKLAALKAKDSQLNLFTNSENPFEVVNKFSYNFTSDDDIERTMMIEDWEIGALYWNSLKRHEGNEFKACEDVKNKYFNDFAKTKDLYLFLGTTREYHLIAPNPFVIIGTFHPTVQTQFSLF